MPNFDRTGPVGDGPMSGWGRGRCSGRGQADFGGGRGKRQGLGAGAGSGFGRGNAFGRSMFESLADQISALQQSLNELKAKSSGSTEASED